MTQNSVVRARINEEVKEEATAVLESIGLTVSDAVRLMMTRIAIEKALPFDPLVPNAETIQAMKDARNGKVHSVENIDELMAELNSEKY
ncbi:MAG: type II toxin-antitoxin system RelB/DinJ family antitoxin [Gammaproteobacteria bacterium]|nr:type II toxin-antitoxin system RelB/DinJ family antitoxin [Gammaproteobacteria bacterium]